ncbi:hypothetical protein SEEM29N_19328, partial [Salmonella enterica subsp. enterica serovar Montevideo str. 29N]
MREGDLFPGNVLLNHAIRCWLSFHYPSTICRHMASCG